MNRRNPYSGAGLVLALTPLLFGLVLFAVLASLFGPRFEQRMEDTWWGTAVLFAPNIAGVLLLIFGDRLPPIHNPSRALRLLGIVLLSMGAFSSIRILADGEPGANIGAGLLLMTGLAIVALSFLVPTKRS